MTNAQFERPYGVAFSFDGATVLVADYSNNAIRSIVVATRVTTTLAGIKGTSGTQDGAGTNAQFNAPFDVAYSPDGTRALVTDINNAQVRALVG